MLLLLLLFLLLLLDVDVDVVERCFGDVDWNTDDAETRFSIYCPNTWFSDFNLRFSSLTLSARNDKSKRNKNVNYKKWKL